MVKEVDGIVCGLAQIITDPRKQQVKLTDMSKMGLEIRVDSADHSSGVND